MTPSSSLMPREYFYRYPFSALFEDDGENAIDEFIIELTNDLQVLVSDNLHEIIDNPHIRQLTSQRDLELRFSTDPQYITACEAPPNFIRILWLDVHRNLVIITRVLRLLVRQRDLVNLIAESYNGRMVERVNTPSSEDEAASAPDVHGSAGNSGSDEPSV